MSVLRVAQLLFFSSTLVLANVASSRAESLDKLALLVGCTTYPHLPKSYELYGPSNDIPTFTRLLKEKFDFKDEQITTLLGWQDQGKSNPTRANIERAFRDLAAKATAGSQVVILVSGHGSQVPVANSDDSGDSSAVVENDGLDEVFLPADVQRWSGKEIPNSIRDDEFGRWLDAIQTKGAHVWVVFDCCHSGTMMRAAETEDTVERPRRVSAEELGVPREAFATVVSQDEQSTTAELAQPSADAKPALSGSVTAFYAAQAFEEAPEMPRPSGAPRRPPKHFYGLFTYTLVQTLQRQKQSLSYGELSQAIVNAYRTERGSRGPTPLFAGDLNREVLGTATWPAQASYQLNRNGQSLQISAGTLQGIAPGSVLAVNPPAGDARDRDLVLGYVRVTQATPFESVVAPCAHLEKAAVPEKSLPEGARCQMVVQDIGDMRVNIALSAADDDEQLRTVLGKAILAVPPNVASLYTVQESVERAEWVLDIASKERASRDYGTTVNGENAVLLVQQVAQENTATTGAHADAISRFPRVYASYPLSSEPSAEQLAQLSDAITADIPKIFTWQNMWRVAGSTAASATKADLRLEVKLLGAQGVVNPTALVDGQRIGVEVVNNGLEDWWVTVLYLDRNLGISIWAADAVKRKSTLTMRSATVDGSLVGNEGFVLLAHPMSRSKLEPTWGSLPQEPLGVALRTATEPPKTPLERLLRGAGIGEGSRNLAVNAPDQPTMQMHTWITKPRNVAENK